MAIEPAHGITEVRRLIKGLSPRIDPVDSFNKRHPFYTEYVKLALSAYHYPEVLAEPWGDEPLEEVGS